MLMNNTIQLNVGPVLQPYLQQLEKSASTLVGVERSGGSLGSSVGGGHGLILLQ
jgi:hypothetical protein